MAATFNPPSAPQSMDDHFWGRFDVQVGISVVKVNDEYQNLPTPTADELIAAGGVEGRDYFLGGHRYRVTDEIQAALEAAGYVAYLTGYGVGEYGDGPYGGI